MKLSNLEMSNYLSYLNKISNKVIGKLAYAVSKNMRKISNELIEFENIRNELIQKYGEKNDEGTFFIKSGSDAYEKFLNEISNYTDIEHEVDIFLIEPDCLYTSNLNANEMLQLDFMIEK